MIRLLFTDFSLIVTNAGLISSTLQPTHGLYQGNQIASFLFTTIIEILANKLRTNDHIKPICIKGIKYLLSQFADDMDIFMKYDVDSFSAAMDTIKTFKEISGMKINLNKTSVYRIGSIRHSKAKFYTRYKVHWTSKPSNLLGINISHNLSRLSDLNYDTILKKASRIMSNWAVQGLSLMDKIQVVNSLVMLLFSYHITVLPQLTDDFVQEYNALITSFLWNGRRAKIPLTLLQRHKQDGGMSLNNLV